MPWQPHLPREALEALEGKYAALVKLRARRDAAPDEPPSPSRMAELRSLATAFPGCLRELDRLSLAGLQRRHEGAASARTGGPQPTWLLWIWGYHQLLAAALEAKSGVAQKRKPGNKGAWPLVSPEFISGALAPPGGRLSRFVLAELSAAVGVPAEAIGELLFPPRR